MHTMLTPDSQELDTSLVASTLLPMAPKDTGTLPDRPSDAAR